MSKHSTGKQRLKGAALGLVRKQLLRNTDNGAAESLRPFEASFDLAPFVGSRRYGWTHYGIMIPNLPDPHRYLSVMVMAGLPGQRAFDVDELVTTTPRDTATVSISTAATGAASYRALSMAQDCVLSSNGDDLRFGTGLRISGRHPTVEVDIETSGLSAHLEFALAERATWFIKGQPYDHLSLLGQYTGWVESDGERQQVEGQGTVEYARCVGPYAVRDILLPWNLKTPVDFFTYQVVDLGPTAQLLFCRVGMLGERLGDVVQYRTRTGDGDWRVNEVATDRTFFEVLEYSDEQLVDEGGFVLNPPRTFRFGVRDLITVTATSDTPPRYGVGRGYISGYTAEVELDEQTFTTRGYAEYVNVHSKARPR